MPSMQRMFAPAVALGLALTGCDSDKVSGANSGPWTGTCDVQAQFVSATSLSITGTCQMPRLGTTQVRTTQTITVRPSGVVDYVNVAKYTTTNGDELHTTSVGTATPNATGLTLAGVETAAGGTGQFKNAVGSATASGAVVFVTATSTTGSYSITGELKY